QVRGQAVDARSDIFSFGCMLYEMANGRRAFEGASAADVMSAILNVEPPEIAASKASVSPGLDAIVRRCLEKDPARRFQSAADLAFALRSVVSTPSLAHPALASGQVRRQKWPIAPAVGAAGLLLFAAGYFLHGRLNRATMPQYQHITFRDGRISAARFSP